MSDYARGLFSNNDLRLYENWNLVNGLSWNTSKWATSSSSSGRIVDIQGTRGRIQPGASSPARATSLAPDGLDVDATLTYEFSDRNAGSDLRIHLRGSGASSPTSGVENAYRLDIESGSTTVKVKKLINGSATTLPNATFAYDPNGDLAPDGGRHRVRFRVEGSSIHVAMWPESATPSGAWNISTTDSSVTAPGKLQLTHYASTSVRSVFIDDLTLLNIPAGGVVETLRGDTKCMPYTTGTAYPSGVSFTLGSGEICYNDEGPPASCYDFTQYEGKYATYTSHVKKGGVFEWSFKETPTGVTVGAGKRALYEHLSYRNTDPSNRITWDPGTLHDAGYRYHGSWFVQPERDASYTIDISIDHADPGGTVVGRIYCEL